ncbi:MAG: TetR/AcrR family transcriptional regulator [Nitrospina sp.]|nr:MAG: TetR/AcrR family transcriptional regulator [Nitrospina sp.]TDJ61344.1 MAG: TetR/AcrR family transcriptional regulator [Nitrospina sp.]
MSTVAATAEEIKSLILDKAVDRFIQYGFGKTTMVEIAKDCGMSAGNLYRYFESKFDIGVGVAQLYICKAEQILRDVLKRPGLSPSQRLEAFVLEKLRFMHSQIIEQPNVQDLVDYILDDRWDLVERHRDVQNSLMAEILSEGNRTGEFNVSDVVHTANAIYALTTKFRLPHFIKNVTLEGLEQEAKAGVDLMIRGIKG